MQNIIITFLIIVLSLASLQAQKPDSLLEKELLSFRDTNRIIMQNGRRLIFSYIEKQQPDKAEHLIRYVSLRLNPAIYPLFTRHEQILLDFYLGKYAPTLTLPQVRPYDRLGGGGICGLYSQDYYDDGYPDIDFRYPVSLIQLISLREDYIQNRILESEEKTDDKAFLKLYFTYYTHAYEDHSLEAVDFLNTYPDYRHNDFVKRHIRKWYVRGEDSWSFYLGGGSPSFSEGIQRTIDYNDAVSYGIDGIFNRFVVGIRATSSYGKVVQSFSHKGEDFNSDWRIYTINYMLSGGFSILDLDFLRLAPTVDFGGIYTGIPTGKEEEYQADPSVGALAYGYGFTMDIFPFQTASSGFYHDMLHRIGLRLHAGRLHNRLEQKVAALTGSQEYVNISIIYDIGEMVIDME